MKLSEALRAAGVPEDQLPGILAAMAPDAARRESPTEPYLRGLLEQAGLSVRGAARVLDVSQSHFRDYLTGRSDCPYPVQYCLEVLASAASGATNPETDS